MKPSRRTITILNRFTTFIRSWRGKTAGSLLFFLVLLFLSCKDDAGYIGFPKGARLNTFFVDIPLNPSVIQYDGIVTRNGAGEALTRILVGKYDDPTYGTTDARAFTNFAPPVSTLAPSTDATLDSVVLQLKVDFYYYGTTNFTKNRLQVVEIRDTLHNSLAYFSNSTVNTSYPQYMGELSFYVDPADFDNAMLVNADTDTSNNIVLDLRIPLNQPLGKALGNNLLQDMISNPGVIEDYTMFTGKYKGLGFVMVEGDKIFGIDPLYTPPYSKSRDSKLLVYYTDGGIQTRADFLLSNSANAATLLNYPVVNFTTFTNNRGSSVLNGIEAFKDFKPANKYMYSQSGTSLVTKFDLTNFYSYVDTLQNIIFNSAQLIITNTSTQKGPFQIQFRVLDSQNHFRSAYIDSTINNSSMVPIDSLVPDPYFNNANMAKVISIGTTAPTVDIITDNGVNIPLSTDIYEISPIFMTEFCQQIYYKKHHARRITSFALMTQEDEFRKSVNGLVLDPSISIRLYYSKPIAKIR